MRIANLTPHTLNLITDNGSLTVPPSGIVARVSVDRSLAGSISVDGVLIPLNVSTYGDITDLPAPQDNTVYVVSALVAQLAANRKDVYYPDDLVRDDQGRVIGARSLARYLDSDGR